MGGNNPGGLRVHDQNFHPRQPWMFGQPVPGQFIPGGPHPNMQPGVGPLLMSPGQYDITPCNY